ncbi:MAG: PilZ domain-containing protein [Desulfomonilaceae bacterium]
MRRKRKISATQVVRDIRSGITQEELQDKYKIALHRVEKLFKRIVAANAVTESELAERYPSYKEAIAGINPSRNRRVLLPFEFIVYDITTSSIGLVRDISETGLRVAGINCNVGGERTFQLPVDIFIKADPVLMVAKCQWVKVRGKTMIYATAGFEITDISDDDRMVLKTFVESLSIVKSGYLNDDDIKKTRVVAAIAPSQDGAVSDREASLSTSATEAAPGLPSWFDEEAMKALQDIYRSGSLQEILAWWEARNRR